MTYYNSDGQPDPEEQDDIGGFTIERDTRGNLTADPGMFYSKSGSCSATITPDITEAEFAVAFAAFLKALPNH